MKIKINKVKCLRCEWEWQPRKEVVLRCANPKCRTPYWDTPIKTQLSTLEKNITDKFDKKLSRKIDKLISLSD